MGIVLTPKHITGLFCDLAGVNKDSIVLDNCCGTGGFLISAMRRMIQEADHNSEKELYIKQNQIVGIEYQDTIFPLVCSNMIIHGDGKANMYNENCFDPSIKQRIRQYRANIGLLNPPFKMDKKDIEEFEFVLNNLEFLEPNAICVALLPMQCVLAQNGIRLELKKRLLENHTLRAVVSLPNEIFHNSKVSTVTCAVVIIAHKSHPQGYKTFFGYWKDDGFVKRKPKGRIDGGTWKSIKEKWINTFRNREEIIGLSVLREVDAEDEWCAEAYMETDYSKLRKEDFINTMKDYIAFQFLTQREDI